MISSGIFSGLRVVGMLEVAMGIYQDFGSSRVCSVNRTSTEHIISGNRDRGVSQ